MTDIYPVHIPPNADVIEQLEIWSRNNNVRDAAIVSVVGALDYAEFSVMNRDTGADMPMQYSQPMELAGNGELNNGVCHLHVALFVPGGTVGGHLLDSTVSADYFVNAYVIPLQPS
jgi:predicted DNA-binding protein with PD1-like motif